MAKQKQHEYECTEEVQKIDTFRRVSKEKGSTV